MRTHAHRVNAQQLTARRRVLAETMRPVPDPSPETTTMANQPQNVAGQPTHGNPHHQALMAAGVPQDQMAQLQAVLPQLQAAGVQFDWSVLLQLVQQYGPTIMALILKLFAQPAPGPSLPGAAGNP